MARPTFPYRQVSGLTPQQQAELLRNFQAAVNTEEVITFSTTTSLIVTTSAPKRLRQGGNIRITADLSGPLTGASTVLVKLDGSSVYTLTIPSTVTTMNVVTGKYAKAGQLLVLDITAVGAGTVRANFDVVLSGR